MTEAHVIGWTGSGGLVYARSPLPNEADQRKLIELTALEFMLAFHREQMGRNWNDVLAEMEDRIGRLRAELGT